MAAGVAPARTNRPGDRPSDGEQERHDRRHRRRQWLIPKRGDEQRRPAQDPVEDDRRPAHRSRTGGPTRRCRRRTARRRPQADADRDRARAAHQQLVGELRVGRPDQLEQRRAREQAERRVDGDPGRGEEPDVRADEDLPVPATARRSPRTPLLRVRAAARRASGTPELVDRERDGVQHRVEQEDRRAEEREQQPDRTNPTIRPASVAASNRAVGPAAERLVARGGERDEPEDRRDRRRRRRPLEDPRPAEDEQVRGREA